MSAADPLLGQGAVAVLRAANLLVDGPAGDLEAGRALLRATRPDVLVTSHRLPPLGRVAAMLLVTEARAAGTRTVVLGGGTDEALVAAAIDHDAAGWGWIEASELANAEQFVSTVLRVGRGGTVISDTLLQRLGAGQRVSREPPSLDGRADTSNP